jgi:hypothetical protein
MSELIQPILTFRNKDNPEKLATYDTQHKEKQQKHNTIYVGHHYTTTNKLILSSFFEKHARNNLLLHLNERRI